VCAAIILCVGKENYLSSVDILNVANFQTCLYLYKLFRQILWKRDMYFINAENFTNVMALQNTFPFCLRTLNFWDYFPAAIKG
jgi:hypothetical protein